MMNFQSLIKEERAKNSWRCILNCLLIALFFVGAHLVLATTPNPGHPWTSVGDGTFQVTGPTVSRTYTFPNASSVVMAAPAFAQGDLLYASAANTFSILAKNTTATRYIANTGTTNNPAWAQVNLTNGVTGTLPGGNGGTGSAFTDFSGPGTSLKTFTLPNASSTILTDNAVVTLTQGGTSKALSASNGGIVWTDADSMEVLAGTATANKMLMSGSSATPSWSTPTFPNASATSGKTIISDGTNYIASTLVFPSATSIAGNQLFFSATGTISSTDLTQDEYMKDGLHNESSATAVTAYANATAMVYATYVGRATKAYSSCIVYANVTTLAAGVTWAEIGIYTGALPGFNTAATLTRRGVTDVNTTNVTSGYATGGSNAVGSHAVTVSVSSIAQGDDVWVGFGQNATTSFQTRGNLADELQSGLFQTATTQISTTSSPTLSVAGNTVISPRYVVKCT